MCVSHDVPKKYSGRMKIRNFPDCKESFVPLGSISKYTDGINLCLEPTGKSWSGIDIGSFDVCIVLNVLPTAAIPNRT